MKNSGKIFTSAFLASVMVFSLTMGAVADETDAPEALAGIESEVTVSVTEPDEPPVIEDSADVAEPMYVDYYEYIGEPALIQTPGGTAGYVTIKFGFYKQYRDGGGGYKQFMNYGVSAQIVDSQSDGSNLKGNFKIRVVGNEYRVPHETKDNAYSDRLFCDLPSGYNYVSLEAYLTFESNAFGNLEDEPIYCGLSSVLSI